MLTQSDQVKKDEQVQPYHGTAPATLEANMVSLSETIDRLRAAVREQSDLIREHVSKQLVAGGAKNAVSSSISPEDALFTFVCRRKFDHVEKELSKLKQLLIGPDAIRKAS
jgi:hypothetical protein